MWVTSWLPFLDRRIAASAFISSSVWQLIQLISQSIRRYAAQGSTRGGPSTTTYALIATVAAGGGGVFYWYNSRNQNTAKSESGKAAPKSIQSSSSNPPLASDPKPPTATFLGGDQGWVDLKLESVAILSHNTKKFRFALPTEDAVSGLRVACEHRPMSLDGKLDWLVTAAILTKYQGPEMEKVCPSCSCFSALSLWQIEASDTPIHPNKWRR